MKKIFLTFLLVVAGVLSSSVWAYDVYENGDIQAYASKILVVNTDATVSRCTVWGDLIVEKGVTLTVDYDFTCIGTIYVFGTLVMPQQRAGSFTYATVYIMPGGSITGGYFSTESTINTDVDMTTITSVQKVKAQIPTPDNNFTGWQIYYQRVIYSSDHSDSYPVYFYEDEACTRPIADIDDWKAAYPIPYQTYYEAGVTAGHETGYEEGYTAGYTTGAADTYTAPTEPGMRLKLITKDGKVYEFLTSELKSAEYYRATEE